MINRNSLVSSLGATLVVAIGLVLASAAGANVVSKEKVLPKNGNLVPFVVSATRPGAIIHNILIDDKPTIRRGFCVSDGDDPLVDDNAEDCVSPGTAEYDIVAIQVGDSFYRPGELPEDLGGSYIAIRSYSPPVWDDEHNVFAVPNGRSLVLWLRVDDDPGLPANNKVALKVTIVASGTVTIN